MNRLKRKMFFTLFSVLLMLAAALTFFMDYRQYMDQKNQLQEQLIKISTAVDRVHALDAFGLVYRTPEDSDDDDEKTSESTDSASPFVVVSEYPAYVASLNRSSEVQRIDFLNSDGEDWETALETAQKAARSGLPGQMGIGNLFTQNYVWCYATPSSITVMNIQAVNQEMQTMLWATLPLLLVEILLIYYISRCLTRWMITPIEETFTRQKQFIADASHELKTPLAVIMANAEAMERDPDQKWLHNIESESERMNALIKSLLDLTRSEQEETALESVNLSFLTEKEISIQEAVMFEKGIEIESHIPSDIFVMGQNSGIEKVLEILLDNAMCHAHGRIQVLLEKKGSQAVLRVENNGELIPAGERQKIFERFYRSDASRNRNENRYGLGLAIAKNLMERMGGSIGAEDRNGMTSFYIRFRLAQGPSAVDKAIQQKNAGSTSADGKMSSSNIAGRFFAGIHAVQSRTQTAAAAVHGYLHNVFHVHLH